MPVCSWLMSSWLRHSQQETSGCTKLSTVKFSDAALLTYWLSLSIDEARNVSWWALPSNSVSYHGSI